MVRLIRADIISAEPLQTSFIVAIDGPAGAGKSSASRRLAERLGFEFLDTGAMYRCVTLAVLRSDIDSRDWARVAELASTLKIRLDRDRVWLNDEEVTEQIRTPEVAKAIGKVADNVEVRSQLTALQRQWAEGKCVVTEGRDQGSVVFHDSPCKIYLVASEIERARRRQEELAARGINLPIEEVLEQQRQRDGEDASRPTGGLKRASDAALVNTDGLSLDEVVQAMFEIVQSRLPEVLKVSAGSGTHTHLASSSQIESRS